VRTVSKHWVGRFSFLLRHCENFANSRLLKFGGVLVALIADFNQLTSAHHAASRILGEVFHPTALSYWMLTGGICAVQPRAAFEAAQSDGHAARRQLLRTPPVRLSWEFP